MAKRFRLTVRATDEVLDQLGCTDTCEDAVMAAVQGIGLVVEEMEGLDYWPDPPVESERPLATGGVVAPPPGGYLVGESGPEQISKLDA